MAGLLGTGVMRVAARYLAMKKYAEAGALVDLARQIDSYFDAWSFWVDASGKRGKPTRACR